MSLHSSGAISGYNYMPKTKTLYLRMTDATKLAYHDVPPEVYEEFDKSSSKGEFFNHHIRGKFEFDTVENAPPRAYLPHAIALLEEALSLLKASRIGSASHHLADALGVIKDYVDNLEGSYSIQGITGPTGRGFQIVNITDSIKELVEE